MRAISLVNMFSIASLTCMSSALAQDGEPLTDDASRGQLFEYMGSLAETVTPPEDFVTYAFRAGFRFPHDAKWKNPVLEQEPRTNQQFGIDVSHHNTDKCSCEINWEELSNHNVTFAYVKASKGTKWYDGAFSTNVGNIKKLPSSKKISVGAYHFLSADGTAEDQATHFLKVTGSLIGANDLVPSLDLEWDVRVSGGKVILDSDGRAKDYWKPVSGKEILSKALKWMEIVKAKTNKTPILYTSQAWWNERMQGVGPIEKAFSGYPIWITDLSSKGLKIEQPVAYKGPWRLWQFSFTATARSGLPVGRTVDANVFFGSMQEFENSMK